MKHEANEVDAVIRKALSPAEAAYDNQLAEPSLFEMATEVFRGRLRWLAFLTVVVMTACLVLVVYCLVQLLRADDAVVAIRWGAGLLFGLLAVSGLKMWHWMEMHRLLISREIKRVELQVAHLSAAMKERGAKE